MAKKSAKGATITVDNASGTPQDISTSVFSYEIKDMVNPEDVTGFGDGVVNYVPGQYTGEVTLDIWYDYITGSILTGATSVIQGIIGSAVSRTVTIRPEASGLAYSGEFLADGITVSGDAQGSPIKLGSVTFKPFGTTRPTWA